jgi:hypothetical protein
MGNSPDVWLDQPDQVVLNAEFGAQPPGMENTMNASTTATMNDPSKSEGKSSKRHALILAAAIALASVAAFGPHSAANAASSIVPPPAVARASCVDLRRPADEIMGDPGAEDITPGVTYIMPFGGPMIRPANATSGIDSQTVTWQQTLFELRQAGSSTYWAPVASTPWVTPYVVHESDFLVNGWPNGWAGAWPVSNDSSQTFQVNQAGVYKVAFRIHWYATTRVLPFDAYQWANAEVRLVNGSQPIDYDTCEYDPTPVITVTAPF